MKRYGLFIAAVLSLFLAVLVVVVLEYRPVRLTPALTLQQAKSEVNHLRSIISEQKMILAKYGASQKEPKTIYQVETEQEVEQLELKLKAAEAEVTRLEESIRKDAR